MGINRMVFGVALLAALPLMAQREYSADLPGTATMAFVWIAPGAFAMGSPPSEAGRQDDEGPRREVRISRGFWLGIYEVTQAQWLAVMGTAPWAGQPLVVEHPDHPAVNLTWNDAQALVARLNRIAGEAVYRLPTEAEWEYACRAGTETRWSFGDDEAALGDYAWYGGNARDVGQFYGHAVGTKLPNAWGVYDMHGNAWEMVADWYGAYGAEPVTDPTGPSTGMDHIVRGGSFGQPARNLRSAKRVHGPLDDLDAGVGVRLVRVGPAPTAVESGSWGRAKKTIRGGRR